jgi:hypothetical protein
VFEPDGTARWTVDTRAGVAAVAHDAGKVRWRVGQATATGQMFQERGRRLLRIVCDDGSCDALLSRADASPAGCQGCGDTGTRASGRSIPGTSTRTR